MDATTLSASLGQADALKAAEAVKVLLDRGVPDVRSGLGTQVFEMAAAYRELFAPYPKLRRYVHLYHPDLQGSHGCL